MNKERQPRDTITALKKLDSDPPEYEKWSSAMAEIARDYHNGLQQEGVNHNDNANDQTRDVLDNITQKVSPNEKRKLAENIKQTEVRQAIKDLPNGKAPGIDGVPHELWKALSDKCEVDKKHKNPKIFDIVAVLTKVYNDIEREGIVESTDFSKGWMCPLYKKKDRTDISNYRPITVLNTDYKIFTRALTTRLTSAVPGLIHHDQAGFMKGRKIEDQTDLVNMMLNKCEIKEDNGIIVCLDQEKAYDKINHGFLWRTLTCHRRMRASENPRMFRW